MKPSLLRNAILGAALGVGLATCDGGAPGPAAPAGTVCVEPEPASLDARHRAIKDTLRALVGDLVAAGRYDCCIAHPCNTCALRMGGCKCGEGLRNGEPVCEECAMMWRSGQGAEDVDPASVRSFLEAQREAEARAAAAGVDAGGSPGASPGAPAASPGAPAPAPAPAPSAPAAPAAPPAGR